MEEVSYALATKAVLLRDERRYEEVVTVVDELLARFGEVEEPSVRRRVADGLGQKAFALGRLGRWEDAVALDEQTIERYSSVQDDPDLAAAVGRAMHHYAYSMERLGRLEDAAAAWGALLDRNGAGGSSVSSKLVGDALLNRARLLLLMGRAEEAIASADAFIHMARDDPDRLPELVEALGARGRALTILERYDEAIKAFDEVVELGRGMDTQPVRRDVVFAITNKATVLWALDRFEEWKLVPAEMNASLGEGGLDAFAEVINHAATADVPAAQPALVSAIFYRAQLLVERGRRDEALADLTDLITRFEDDDEESIQAIVGLARDLQERLIAGREGA
jgi:tetratricopeptide (TPR) repeat protein